MEWASLVMGGGHVTALHPAIRFANVQVPLGGTGVPPGVPLPAPALVCHRHTRSAQLDCVGAERACLPLTTSKGGTDWHSTGHRAGHPSTAATQGTARPLLPAPAAARTGPLSAGLAWHRRGCRRGRSVHRQHTAGTGPYCTRVQTPAAVATATATVTVGSYTATATATRTATREPLPCASQQTVWHPVRPSLATAWLASLTGYDPGRASRPDLHMPGIVPCTQEDGSAPGQSFPCRWDASAHGNGQGTDYVLWADGTQEDIPAYTN